MNIAVRVGILSVVISLWSLPARAEVISLDNLVQGTSGNVLELDASQTYSVNNIEVRRDFVIDGNGASVQYGSGAIIAVQNGSTATFKNMDVTGGLYGFFFDPGTHGIIENVTIDGQQQNVIHKGNGSLVLRDCAFSNAGNTMVFGEYGTDMEVLRTTLRNSPGFGIQVYDGTLSVTDTVLDGFRQGIVAVNNPQAQTQPIIMRRVEMSNIDEFGIVIDSGAKLIVEDTEVRAVRTPFELRDGVQATFKNVFIDSDGRPNAQNAIAMRNNCSLTITDSSIYGHLNSIDAQVGSQVFAEGNYFEGCDYSAFIITQNSSVEAIGNEMIDCGQDGVYVGNEKITTDTSSSVVRNNFILGAGSNLNANTRAGTGIAIAGNAYHLIENNIVLESYDMGIYVGSRATGDFRNNLIMNNRLSGILIADAGNTRWVGNATIGHNTAEQAGITLFDGHGRVDFHQGLIAENRYGIIKHSNVDDVYIRDCLVSQNEEDGMLILDGKIDGGRIGFLENYNWQAFIQSPMVCYLNSSTFSSTRKQGVYTERGDCGESTGNHTYAWNCYWNSPDGYWDRCNGASPDDRMECRNIDAPDSRRTPPVEAFYSMNVFEDVTPARVSQPGTVWLKVNALDGGGAGARFGATRPVEELAPSPAPPEAVDNRPVYLWSTNAFRDANTVEMVLSSQAVAGRVDFARYDANSGEFDRRVPVQVSGEDVQIIGPGADFVNGMWYLVRRDVSGVQAMLLGLQSSSLAGDTNGDGIVDAADCLPVSSR